MTDPLLLELVRRRTPLHPRLLEGETGDLVVRRRMRALGIDDPSAYRERVARDPAELEALVVAVAVPETWFFRYRASYDLLASWLRERLDRSPSATLRVLSAPCATGQEPLSVAATALHAGWPAERIEIDAVDANAAAIAIAEQADRAPLPVREPLPAWAAAHLVAVEGGAVASEAILRRIRFMHADLLKWAPPEGRRYDVILCRNFLIYLAPDARREMLRRCDRWLAPDGLLLVGHADHDARSIEGFASVGRPQTFAYTRRAAEAAAPLPAASRRASRREPPAARPIAVSRSRPAAAAPPRAPLPIDVAGAASTPDRAIDLAAARSLADQGRLEEAASIASEASEDPGLRIEALELLGSVRLAQGSADSARECFRRLVYLVPEHESGLLQLALLSEHEGDHEAATRYRERARRAAAREAGG